MTLIITGSDVQRLLSMKECIDAMRHAFADYSNGIAVNRPRIRYETKPSKDKKLYWGNVHAGAVPFAGVACVRAGSQVKVLNEPGTSERESRNENPSPFSWGLLILFSLETAEPVAFMHEFELSGMRVGATTGATVDEVARPDASVLGLFGSGKQARASLQAISAVRPIRRVQFYSPNADHRRAFALDMTREGLDVIEALGPQDVIKGADIVCCATAAARPVFDGNWLEDGQMVISIVNSDAKHKRMELDNRTTERASAVIINDWQNAIDSQQTEILEPIEANLIKREQVFELGDLFSGKVRVRQPARGSSDSGIICYRNNGGLGIQFAAAAGVVYRKAVEEGVCREIPTEWFGADLSHYIAAGFHPSP